MSEDCLIVRITGPVATLTLTRPLNHNALDGKLAGLLTQAVQKAGVAEAIRVLVLEGAGDSFCAGIDLAWLARAEGQDPAAQQRDAAAFAVLLDAIDRCAKPVIAKVGGPALGLGAGLVAACDMAVASEAARFAFPEVRAGLSPALSLPYLAAAVGSRALRRYLLTGERFDAALALRLGLVHGVVAPDRLDEAVSHLVEACLKGAPRAQGEAKDMLRVIADSPDGPDLLRYQASCFAQSCLGAEGRTGLEALTAGNDPPWVPPRKVIA